MVYRLALSYTKSRQDAEDVCQATFLKLIEHKDKIQDGKERAWLASVAANQCRDLLRSFWRRNIEPLSEELEFETPEESDVFRSAMALRPKERIVLYLYYYEGFSTAEIAGMLSITQSAVTTRLGRARKILRDSLEVAANEV